MNPSNNNGNGCTLEDCHTNLFALTELDGIKWRKLGSDGTYCVEPLDDPVLRSFSKCIQSDILCVWRRVPNPHGSRTGPSNVQNMHSHKELWIFWYGDEPVNLPNLLSQELQELERGSWDSGLSYECRTLLFKALHNLIERCLLSQNFVRIGKWFVQPYPHYNTNTCGIVDKSSHLSIRFSFFLHGDSTVCASIDVREHPPLRYLHPQHLSLAAQTSVPVILAPYGLAATLTGQSYRETDHHTQKLLEEWREFYVLPNWDRLDGGQFGDNSHVAPVVEVVVAGMRMKYPSCFVMMLAEKEAELVRSQESTPTTTSTQTSTVIPNTPHQGGIPSVSMTSPPSPCVLSVIPGESPSKSNATPISGYLFAPTLEPGLHRDVASSIGRRIAEKSWQDSTVTSGTNMHSRHQQTEPGSGNTTEDSATMTWDYGEPLSKNSCVCTRTRSSKSRSNPSSLNKPSLSNPSKHVKSEKGDKSDKLRHGGAAPFHRRVGSDTVLQHKVDSVMQRIPPTSLTSLKQTPSSSVQNNGIPQLRGSTTTNMEANVESPHSAAPSPLMATQTQPNVSHNGDPTMPTLSPHPPAKNSDKDLGMMGSSQGDGHDVGARNITVNGDIAGGGANQCALQAGQPAVPNSEAFTKPSQQQLGIKSDGFPGQFPAVNEVVKADNVNTWLQVQKHKLQSSHGLKRPMLPTQGYQEDEEELVTEALYNFSSVQAFLEQPIKKCRNDLDNNRMRPGPQPSSAPLHKGRQRDKSPQQQPNFDPYEFSDDSSSDPGNFSNRSIRNSRDDSFARSSPFGIKQDDDFGRNGGDGVTKSSLDLSPETPGTVPGAPIGGFMREEDLKPTVNDLDNIFDTDSESSDPDPLGRMAHLPTNHINSTDDGVHTNLGRGSNCTVVPTTNIGELTQMYPTPPSQEPQHTLSPGNTLMELPPDLDTMTTKLEPSLYSIDEQVKSNIHDWSYVYKPPLVCKYEGSSKYAPIELASSHQDPLVTPPELHYKPSWHQFPPMPIMDKAHHPPLPPGHYQNLPSVENVGSVGPKPAERMTSIEASPATFGPNSAQQRTPRTPMSYELQSPASNASSYMKNLNSVDNHPTNSQRPEGHSLVVNVMLSDSLLNVFKDHNFDSCSMCVCNMNIKGNDITTYLPDKTPEDQYPCSCGFSAIVNRKYGNNSGLFYEDEVDITGVRSERLEHHKPSLATLLNQDKDMKDKLDPREAMPHDLVVLLQGHFSSLFPSCIVPRNTTSKHITSTQSQEIVSFMEIQDGCEACLTALEVGRQAADNCSSQRLDEVGLRSSPLLHKWPFVQSAKTPTNSQDVVRLLKSLRPLLQDAIQKKRTTRLWESVYTILGPLTWKDFHLLAGRGAKKTIGPQPIPPLLVGYDKDWLALSPYALRHWDRMMLEPYSKPRDMAYVIITPDNKYILSHVSIFFKELSSTYEACRFGRHRPFTKKFKDGMLRVSQNYYNKVADEAVDDWFYNLGSSPLATKLRQYIQVCSKYLAPFLAQQTLDKSIFEPPPSSHPPPQRSQNADGSQSSFHSQSAYSSSSYSQGNIGNMPGSQSQGGGSTTGDSQASSQGANSEDNKDGDGQSGNKDSATESETDSADSQMPCLVIYMVDPFAYGQDWDNMNRLATLGLFRCYQEMLKALPESLQQCTQLQIIPLQAIVDFQEMSSSQYLKNICMSVYTQSRRILTHTIPGRSLTGFGPAAAAEKVLKSKEEHQVGSVQLYSPPYVLGNLKSSTPFTADKDGAGVMMCAYCLSEDQRWLLAVCTDSNGELLETCTINIEIPNRNRRKKASARRIGLQKLWDFLVGLLSQSAKMWRLVIGRLGRLGHGELKGWAYLLNKKNLQTTSSQLRQMCPQCSILNITDSPSIVSACLVSMESHPTINITPDSLVYDERPSSNCPLRTPQDASCTHILVFPTSARAQPDAQKDNHMDTLHMPGLSMVSEEKSLLDDLPDGLTDDDILGGISGIEGGFDDIFGIIMPNSPPNVSNHGSPTPSGMPGQNEPLENGFPKVNGAGFMDMQEENPALLTQLLLQQPLAMGFYVSTAKTGPLPKWFWGACPHREDVCPACFKAALHIHCPNFQQNQDEFDNSARKHSHPLDSNLTCDVLRYVLETYNALSWLTMDSATNDRRSCLPAHFVVLMQLYHAVNSLV